MSMNFIVSTCTYSGRYPVERDTEDREITNFIVFLGITCGMKK